MGRLSFMELLLNHGANIGARRKVIDAQSYVHIDPLFHGLCICKDGYGALDAACRNGHVKAIDLLVNFQANINEEDQVRKFSTNMRTNLMLLLMTSERRHTIISNNSALTLEF